MKAYDLGDHIDVLSERLEIEKHKEGCPTTILNEVLAFLRSDIGRHIIELATFKSALQMLHPSPDAASEADKGPARLGPFADVHDAAQEDMDRYAYGKGRHSSGRSKSWYYDYSTDDVDDEEEEPYPGF
jgi:hypothetical protein